MAEEKIYIPENCSLEPYFYDKIVVGSYNSGSKPLTVTYSLNGTDIFTNTMTYDSSNRVLTITRTDLI